MNAVTQYDIDGTALGVSTTVTLTEGITVTYFTELGASKPHEVALRIGDSDCIEMNYSEELADLFARVDEVPAVEFLATCYANLWRLKQ
ncbi:hypothetical protein [Psychrobacillus sp. FSL K6-1415]|uniref:hypothetical protein n=1 Tax=Psychrobacillus sp. FSL K6-1415 TaxID=2921544 RepID=UPI0030FC7EB4